MKKGKALNVFFVCGILCIVSAVVLTVYNFYTDYSAGEESQKVLGEFYKKTEDNDETNEVPAYILNPNMEMPIFKVDNNDYVGILSIPALDLEVPVMSDWSYSKFKVAPCRYSGSAYKEGFVIAAHNYRKHFGRLKKLSIGDEIIFTDADGNAFRYEVASLETLMPTDIEVMISDEWDLSLFTCTVGGRARVTVRCVKADN